MMETVDWNGVFFGLGVLILATIVLVAFLIQAGAFARARIARKTEDRLEELVGEYQRLSSANAAGVAAVNQELAGIRQQLTSVDEVLRTVG